MIPSRFSRIAIWTSFLMASCAYLVHAQPPKAGGKNAKKAPSIEISGKLYQWQGNAMTVLNEQGQKVTVGFPQKSSGLTFKAPMLFEGIAKGMMVRVEAPASGGKFLEPFKNIEVIIPDTSSLTSKSSLNDRSRQIPGIYPMNQVTPPAPGQMGSPNIRVVGAVLAVDATKMALQCGNKSTTIELDPQVKIDFSASTLRFANAGDRVRVIGQMNPATGQFLASKVEVTGAKPVGNNQSNTPSITSMKLRVKEKEKEKLTSPEESAAANSTSPEGANAASSPNEPTKPE